MKLTKICLKCFVNDSDIMFNEFEMLCVMILKGCLMILKCCVYEFEKLFNDLERCF